MKKQMKTNLLFTIASCLLFSIAMLAGSSTGPNNQAAMLPSSPLVKNKDMAMPVAALESLPFTFYLSLVSCFTNGGSLSVDFSNPAMHSIFWEEDLASISNN